MSHPALPAKNSRIEELSRRPTSTTIDGDRRPQGGAAAAVSTAAAAGLAAAVDSQRLVSAPNSFSGHHSPVAPSEKLSVSQ